MGELEQQIIEMFRRLPADSQAAVLDALRDVAASEPASLSAWLREAQDARFTPCLDPSGRAPSASELV
ncbi:hypothetical protein FJZ36_15980 [Candidatus Poribacteria bacterium]|nr:hypothetical protein [Candidatus Poribacteria bacterium]